MKLAIGQVWQSKKFEDCTIEILDITEDLCYGLVRRPPTLFEKDSFVESYILNNYELVG